METIIILIALLVFIYILNQMDQSVGKEGEMIVRNILSQLPDEYTVRNNVKYGFFLFPHTQIDHIVRHPYSGSIFVIETKMWGGIITGSRKDEYWQQYKDGTVRYFNNPIIQNERHCRVVRKRYPGYKIHNVVVMVRNKNIPDFKCVINEDMLLNYISKKVSNRGVKNSKLL